MRTRLIALIPFVFVLLWSTGFVGAKYGLPHIEPFFMLALRFGIAIAVFAAIAVVLRNRPLPARQALGQMLVGCLLHAAYLGGVFFAIKSGLPAGIVAVIVGIQPILTAIFGRIWLAQEVNGRQTFGLVLGFAGIALVVGGAAGFGEATNWPGLIASGVALVGISAGTIVQKQIGADTPILVGTMYQYIGAGVAMTALTFFVETQTVDFQPSLIAAMLWLVFGLSVSATLLLMLMVRQGEVSKVASYFYLVPPVTVLETWYLFGEKLSSVTILGGILTVIAVYLVAGAKPETKAGVMRMRNRIINPPHSFIRSPLSPFSTQ